MSKLNVKPLVSYAESSDSEDAADIDCVCTAPDIDCVLTQKSENPSHNYAENLSKSNTQLSYKSQSEKHTFQSTDEQTKSSGFSLPLPKEVLNMFESTDNSFADTDKHSDWIRSFPHERGVWATLVFIEYIPDCNFYNMIEHLKTTAGIHGVNLKTVDDFHISLSRTLKLRHHWISPFIDALKLELNCFTSFRIMLQSTEVYVNEEKTRTFVGLKVHLGCDQLLKIIDRINKCLHDFQLPFFYQDPSFHLSCAACVGDETEKIQSFMADLNICFQTFLEENPQNRAFWVKNIYCKSGNKLFTIPLKT